VNNSRFRSLRSRLRAGLVVGALVLGTVLVSADAQAQPAAASISGQTFTSGIQIENVGTAATTSVTLTYYDTNGTVAATQTIPTAIAPGASYTVFGNTMSAPAGFSGSVVVSADQPIEAITNLLASNPTMGEAYDGIAAPATTVNIPLFQQNNSGYNSTLYVQDASGSGGTVTATFNGGTTPVTDTFALPANGSVVINATNDGLGTGKFVGSVTVTGTNPIAAEVNQSNGTQLLSYTGSGAGGPAVYAPLLMNNNGGYSTGFQVQNVGTLATTVSLFLNGSTTAVATAPLNPGQSVTWYPVPGTSAGFVGSGKVTSSNGQNLLGVVNELNAATGQAMTYDAFNTGTATVNMPLIMYGNSGYFTGEQIQNIGSTATTVTLSINGTVVATQPIAAGASFTWYGSNLIPGGGKVGSATATASAGGTIVGVVNEITSPQQSGDTSFSYEGFNQ
jgi:hypothetical protein